MNRMLVSLVAVAVALLAVALADPPAAPPVGAEAPATRAAAAMSLDEALDALSTAATVMARRGLAGHGETLWDLVKTVKGPAGTPASLTESQRARLRSLAADLAIWAGRTGPAADAPPADVLDRLRALSLDMLLLPRGAATTMPSVITIRLFRVPPPATMPTSGPAGAATVQFVVSPGSERFVGLDGLRTYLQRRRDRLSRAAVLLQPADDMVWRDVIGAYRVLVTDSAIRTVSFAAGPGFASADVLTRPSPGAADSADGMWPPAPLTVDRALPRGLVDATVGKRRVLVCIDATEAHFGPISRIVARLLGRMAKDASMAVYATSAAARPVRVLDWTAADPLGVALTRRALSTHEPPKMSTNFVAAVTKVLDAGEGCDVAIIITEGRRIENKGNTQIALANLQGCPTAVCLMVVGQPAAPVEAALRRATAKVGAPSVFITATQLHAIAGKE